MFPAERGALEAREAPGVDRRRKNQRDGAMTPKATLQIA